MKNKRWSKTEDKVVSSNLTMKEAAKKINRTEKACASRRFLLSTGKNPIDKLNEWRDKNPQGFNAIMKRYRDKSRGRKNSKKKWNSKEDQIVMAANSPDVEIAKMLKRSTSAIATRRWFLNK